MSRLYPIHSRVVALVQGTILETPQDLRQHNIPTFFLLKKALLSFDRISIYVIENMVELLFSTPILFLT